MEKEQLITLLKRQKTNIEYQTTLVDNVEEQWKRACNKIDKEINESLKRKVVNLNQIIKVELAILDSLKGVVSEETIDSLRTIFVTVRLSNDLRNANGIYTGSRSDVRSRQVLKLAMAVYRYNRQIISGFSNYSVLGPIKSRIKYATLCPHCGEIALKVLNSLRAQQVVSVPEF